mgnify:FL=1
MSETIPEERDSRGEWSPGLVTSAPLYHWPPRPLEILKWLLGYPGYFFPWIGFFMLLPIVTWFFLTPELTRMKTLELDWIAAVYLRNLVLLVLIAGGFHLRLYVQKAQDIRYKFNRSWLLEDHPGFLFGNQTWDNIFWSTVSGCGFWTAYEVLTYWAYANQVIPFLEWESQPVYFVLLYLAVHPIREVHFYFTHRILHWKPLYKSAHYLHHKNVNIGPWSGLAMHPVEHLLYFTGVLLHWIVLSHPLHAIFHLQHAAFTAPWGHTGFEKIEVTENTCIPKASDYFHYLHHRYFECNYGGTAIPLDQWFGSFHDGSEEANEAIRKRRRSMHG